MSNDKVPDFDYRLEVHSEAVWLMMPDQCIWVHPVKP